MIKSENLSDMQRDKRQFTRRHIKELMKALDPDIVRVEYSVSDDNTEHVILNWKNGHIRRVNVTMDSLLTMTKDVLRTLS